MSDLDQKEQNHVRAALHYLGIQLGGMKPVAKVVNTAPLTLYKVMGQHSEVSASLALRVARLLDVPFDDLLLGRYQPGACPKCETVNDNDAVFCKRCGHRMKAEVADATH